MLTQYHCYLWHGPVADLEDVTARTDAAVALPPIRLDGWLAKPASMRETVLDTVDEAEGWLRRRLHAYASCMAPAADGLLDELEHTCKATADNLHRGHSTNLCRSLDGGMYLIVAVAITTTCEQ